MWQSLIVAFSMYSKIPMPKIEWNKKNMKYALVFFPFVGIVIAVAMYGAYWLCEYFRLGVLFRASLLTILPILLTGGIHMDGYLDTIDALHSYGDQQKKQAILKDPNCGAFAVIFGLVYIVANIGIWSELSLAAVPFLGVAYVSTRTLSAFSIAMFPLAKNTGLAATFQDGAHKKNVKRILGVFLVLEMALYLAMDVRFGAVVIVVSLLCFLYHYLLCKNTFGGINGDLAGYFLQICELAVSAALLLTQKIIGM